MNKAQPTTQQPSQNTPPNKFVEFIRWCVTILGILLISIFLSIIIEWLGIAFEWWVEPSYYHAKSMFETELNWVLGDFLSEHPALSQFFLTTHNGVYYYLIQQSGLEWASQSASGFILTGVLSAIYIIEVVFIRIIVILCAFPALFIFGCIATVDALYIRKMRQLTGAIEKAGIHHHVKRWIRPLIITPIVVLLAFPVSIHPTFFVLAVSILPAMTIWITVSTYKKYW